MSKKSVLEEAQELLHGARMEEYGSPVDSFKRISKMWSIFLDTEVTPEQVALCLIQMKVSRAIYSNKRDSFVDIAGYAGTLELLHDESNHRWAEEAQALDTE